MCHIAFSKIALKNDRPLAIAISYLHYNTKCELWSGKAPINRSTNHILCVLYHKHYGVGIVLPRHINLTGLPVPARYYERGQLREQRNTTILYGWDFVVGNGGVVSKTIQFGVTFKEPPVVICTTAGYSSANPTNIAGQGSAGEIVRGGMATTRTSTSVLVSGSGGGGVPNGVRVTFNILVIGEVER